jgi:hypothetical protein
MWPTAVVRENSRVASGEVKGASLGVADENGCASIALVEIQPLLRLFRPLVKYPIPQLHEKGRCTLGCQ